jgi:hypothetical protein
MTKIRSARARAFGVVMATALVASLAPMTLASAESGQIQKNTTCKELIGDPAVTEVKVETPGINNGATAGPITFTGVNAAKTLMGFTSTASVHGVFVKGGPDGGFFYDYRPSGATSGSNMGTNGDGNGRHQISHVSFCFVAGPEPLQISKTADGTATRNVSWALAKTVDPDSHVGVPGQPAGTSTWKIVATKTVTGPHHKVTGTITVKNPNGFAVPVEVTDSLGPVDCDPVAAGNQGSGTVPAKTVSGFGTLTCTYTLDVATRVATNTASVVVDPYFTPELPPTHPVTKPVAWTDVTNGDDEVVVTDPRLTPPFPQTISDSTTWEIPETFSCPPSSYEYVNGALHFTETNTATLTGPHTGPIVRSASVDIHCADRWKGETATGQGPLYPSSANWFMYTPYSAAKVDLIAGQHYDAGDITMVRNGATTAITIKLHAGFRFAGVSANVKIQDFASAPTAYVSPGKFKHKVTVNQATNEITVTVPTADFYGIHCDVERLVS